MNADKYEHLRGETCADYCDKLEAVAEERDAIERENAVLKDNFMQAMILYNKSEDERKEVNSKYLQAVQNEENLKNEVGWLRANQQKNAKHHNKIISELAAEVLNNNSEDERKYWQAKFRDISELLSKYQEVRT